MKKKTKVTVRKDIPKQGNPYNIVFGLLVLAYILIPTFTPNLMAFDSNAPKFLAMAIVNLVAFIALFFNHPIRQKPAILGNFFKTGVGLVYSGFLLASLMSLFNAVNLGEGLVQLVKVFTIFSAVFILSAILMQDLRYLKWVAIVFTGLLIFDSLSVFYYINQFIQGRIGITDIKTIYSNKNILASALFVKLPFALWLLMFRKDWLRWLGWVGIMTGVTAVFFMATRAFYLGLIILSVLLLAYVIVAYLRTKQKAQLRPGGYYLLALLLAYLAFTGTQQLLYPKNISNRMVQGVGEQLATINTSDASINVRLQSWEWSWDLIREKPLFGVGSGNWKVVILKLENKESPDFEYLFKAHNDFIETAAETGLVGGLLYLGIIVLIAWAFLRRIISGKQDDDDLSQYLFLAASGVAFYSVDATFNFPVDRPEIQVLFSFYVAAGIAVIHHIKGRSDTHAPVSAAGNIKKQLLWPLTGLAIILLAINAYFLLLNFQSLKTQRIIYQEIQTGKLRSPSEKIIAGFPFIPTVTILGESVATQKARYLLNENKDKEAVAVLRADNATPWDGRREYFMAMGYNKLNMQDSSLACAEKLREIKPNYYKNIQIACNTLEQRKEYDKVSEYINTYLEDNKTNNQAWVYASGFYERTGEIEKAWQMIEEAKKYLPSDTLVEKQSKYLYRKKFVEPFREQFTKGKEYFDKKDYRNALVWLDRYIGNVPDDFYSRQLRAFSYYHLNDYQKSIDEIEVALPLGENAGALINLRGVCKRALDDLEAACKDFEKAMQMGNADGKTNYDRFCKK